MNQELRMKTKLKKGDQVELLLGKDRGKSGKIAKIDSKSGQVFVEGVNSYKRHVRKMGDIEGGIIEIVKPMNISNVALVCPSCKKPTRIGFVVKGNEKSRICRRCKKAIDTKESKK